MGLDRRYIPFPCLCAPLVVASVSFIICLIIRQWQLLCRETELQLQLSRSLGLSLHRFIIIATVATAVKVVLRLLWLQLDPPKAPSGHKNIRTQHCEVVQFGSIRIVFLLFKLFPYCIHKWSDSHLTVTVLEPRVLQDFWHTL